MRLLSAYYAYSMCRFASELVGGSVPIRRILKKYIVWVNKVFLWKKNRTL